MRWAGWWPLILAGCFRPESATFPGLNDPEDAQLLWIEGGPGLYAADREHPLGSFPLAADHEGVGLAYAIFDKPLSELRLAPGLVSLAGANLELDGSVFAGPAPSRRLQRSLGATDWEVVENFGEALEALSVVRPIRPSCIDRYPNLIVEQNVPFVGPDNRIVALLPFDEGQLLAATLKGALLFADPALPKGDRLITELRATGTATISGYQGGASDREGRAWLVTKTLGVVRVDPPLVAPEDRLAPTREVILTTIDGGSEGERFQLAGLAPSERRVYFYTDTSSVWRTVEAGVPLDLSRCSDVDRCHEWRLTWLGMDEVVLLGRSNLLVHVKDGLARNVSVQGCDSYTALTKLGEDRLVIACNNNNLDFVVRTDRAFRPISRSSGLRNFPTYTILPWDDGLLLSGGDSWTAFLPEEEPCDFQRTSVWDASYLTRLGDTLAMVAFDFDDRTHQPDGGGLTVFWFALGPEPPPEDR